jgi:hypothetical protein
VRRKTIELHPFVTNATLQVLVAMPRTEGALSSPVSDALDRLAVEH